MRVHWFRKIQPFFFSPPAQIKHRLQPCECCFGKSNWSVESDTQDRRRRLIDTMIHLRRPRNNTRPVNTDRNQNSRGQLPAVTVLRQQPTRVKHCRINDISPSPPLLYNVTREARASSPPVARPQFNIRRDTLFLASLKRVVVVVV